jgi:predicted nucleic acid-binding protein
VTTAKKPIRAYVDTSVFGGVYDAEFADHSRAFFDRVGRGEIIVLLGRTTEVELSVAPPHVRGVLEAVPSHLLVRLPTTDESVALQEAYLVASVVSRKWANDALQVAAATIARADVLVSWNFKHIVRFDRMRAFNAVNFQLGHQHLSISSPSEVRYAGQDEVL